MSDLRTAALRALEYMKSVGQMDMYPEEWAIVERLEAALAEPAQESVAIADGTFNHDCPIGTLLYASPQPQQTEPSQDTPPQHEYEVTANDDGTFSVALPDGEELRIIPPQRPAQPVRGPVAGAAKSVHDKVYSEVELAAAYQQGWNHAMLRRSLGPHIIKEGT